MTALAEMIERRELLTNLTLRELRGKFKRTALGWAWSMLNPVSQIAIYSIVFSQFLAGQPDVGNPSGLKNFTLWLTCALLSWNFTNNGLQATIPSLIGNSNLVKKVYFPREFIAASSVLSWLVTFLIELTVLCFFFLLFGQVVFQWIPLVLVFVVLQTLFVLGLALMFSALNVYFRDVQHFVGIFMQVWFYLTPIVYRTALADEKIGSGIGKTIYRLNPMLRFVDAYRDLLYSQRVPPVGTWVGCAVVSIASLLLGWIVFSRLEPRFAEEL
jgi:ABC-type polysaccharide/polyol phosphate export permease